MQLSSVDPGKINNYIIQFLTLLFPPDVVDIKPENMENLTEVITAAEYHPVMGNVFVYSSSKGSVRLCDMREAALCDRHAKCEFPRKKNT